MKTIKKRYLAIIIIAIMIIATAVISIVKFKSDDMSQKEKEYLISVTHKFFTKHMNDLLNDPSKKNIESSYTITNTKIIAGDKHEFVADVYYDLIATMANDTDLAHMKWTVRIKESSADKYKIVDEGAWVKTTGLKPVKNPPDPKVKKNPAAKMSLNSPNKYAIRGSRVSVTYDSGKRWVDVPVSLDELLNETQTIEFNRADDVELDDGSYYISPKITAFVYGADAGPVVEPLKVVITTNKGKSWNTVNIQTDDAQYGYDRKFIGFTSEKQGYLVLTSSVAMGHQENSIYETNDGGKTWSEIGNTNKVYARVVTGAGFANDKIGFIGFRYESENNPTVYRTEDAGKTWWKINIKLPSQYANDYATPLCPIFKGANGLLPVKLRDRNTTIQFYTNDYGKVWKFDKEVEYSNKMNVKK